MSDELETLLRGIPQEDHEAIVNRVQARINNAAVEELQAYHDEKNKAKNASLEAAYRREMTDPANRGKVHLLHEVKAKYRAMGLNVDAVSF